MDRHQRTTSSILVQEKAIRSGLPGAVYPARSISSPRGLLRHLRTGPASVLCGTRVSISAPAADACTAAGAKTVTVWQPASTLTRFLGSDARGGARTNSARTNTRLRHIASRLAPYKDTASVADFFDAYETAEHAERDNH